MNLEGLTIKAIVILGFGIFSACSFNDEVTQPAPIVSGQQNCSADNSSDGSCQQSIHNTQSATCREQNCSLSPAKQDEMTRYCNRVTTEAPSENQEPQSAITFACY